MAENSNIEWTDATFNPWIGCTKVSPGCDHCYAERQDKFRGWTPAGWGTGNPRRRTSASLWAQPVKWNTQLFAECGACGWRGNDPHEGTPGWIECPTCGKNALAAARRRVFCASLADVFDNEIDPQWRADLFRLIADTPNLDWLLLTKRVGNAKPMMDALAWNPGPPGSVSTDWRPLPNVWLGATIVNQEEADRDIPKLLATPARMRFLSMEPLLGPVDLGRVPNLTQNKLDWVIVGGESGPQARPMRHGWARSLRDQCANAGVPFLFKQWGECLPAAANGEGTFEIDDGCGFDYDNGPDRLRIGWVPDRDHDAGWDDEAGWYYARVGKKAAGRLLDGRTHDQFPEVTQ